jgi:hypothetical protein
VRPRTSGGRNLNGVLKQPIDRLESWLYVTLKITPTSILRWFAEFDWPHSPRPRKHPCRARTFSPLPLPLWPVCRPPCPLCSVRAVECAGEFSGSEKAEREALWRGIGCKAFSKA